MTSRSSTNPQQPASRLAAPSFAFCSVDNRHCHPGPGSLGPDPRYTVDCGPFLVPSLPCGPRAFGAPADHTFVIWSFLMVITRTHSWETPNVSGHVPFCYSSRRHSDFMERVSNPLCADNDQSSMGVGVGGGSSPRLLRLQNAGRGGGLPRWEDQNRISYNKEELKPQTDPKTLSRPAASDWKCASVLCPELHFCLSNFWRRVPQTLFAPR